MSIKIETGIPVPVKRSGVDGVANALRSMKEGDSFVADKVQTQAAYQAATRIGCRIAVREVGPGKVRIWRLGARTA